MRTVGRWLAGVAGVLLLLAGGLATWATAEQRDSGGWFTTGQREFRTDSRALVTEEIEIATGRTGDPPMDIGELANVRVRVARADGGGQPLFVGIGRVADVDRYLRGVPHDRLDRIHRDPFRAEFRRTAGDRAPARPLEQDLWAATGSDSGALTWDKSSGAWALAVMNEDGSPGVHIRADVGLRFGSLPWVALSLLLAGVLLLLLAWLPGRRKRRHRRPAKTRAGYE